MPAEHDSGSLRLFVALEIPDHWRDALAAVQHEQERRAPGYFRWVAPELQHLTVVFIGQLPAESLGSLAGAIERAAAEVSPITLTILTTGWFGPTRAPRVVFARVAEPDGRLAQLRRSLERELSQSGLPFDDKPLVAHITLGRSRRASAILARPVERAIEAARHVARRVVLFESQLSPQGPTYRVRSACPLSQTAT